jgi:hypothetical protein
MIEALFLESVTLVAVRVYTPATVGAVNVALPPFWLVAGLTEPPVGATLQVTPALSFVLAVSVSACVIARPARPGAAEIVMSAGLTFNLRLTLRVCAVLPESLTVAVSGVPAAVAAGVPEITPPAALSARPAGSAPAVAN